MNGSARSHRRRCHKTDRSGEGTAASVMAEAEAALTCAVRAAIARVACASAPQRIKPVPGGHSTGQDYAVAHRCKSRCQSILPRRFRLPSTQSRCQGRLRQSNPSGVRVQQARRQAATRLALASRSVGAGPALVAVGACVAAQTRAETRCVTRACDAHETAANDDTLSLKNESNKASHPGCCTLSLPRSLGHTRRKNDISRQGRETKQRSDNLSLTSTDRIRIVVLR